MAQEGVKIESEKRQRQLSKQLISTVVEADVAPFTFALKNGGEEVRPAAMACVPYLPDKIFELLDELAR